MVFLGLVVPKGDYSLYLLPDVDKWQLIFSKQTGQPAGAYNPRMDLGRVPMILRSASAPSETCKLTLTKSAARAASLSLRWKTKSLPPPITSAARRWTR